MRAVAFSFLEKLHLLKIFSPVRFLTGEFSMARIVAADYPHRILSRG